MSYIEREPLLEVLNGLHSQHLTMYNYAADGATQDCIEAVIEAPVVDIKSKVAREIGEKIHEIAEECGGGVLFYQRMRKFVDELKKGTYGGHGMSYYEDVVRCKDCKYLTIINDGEVYARCEQTSFEFQPFGTDTRVHYCGYGERREK